MNAKRFVALLSLTICCAKPVHGQTHDWTRQFGTSGLDFNYRVSADGLGNIYVAGGTEGSIGGANAGDSDALISKYDASGTLLWSRQFGTSGLDRAYGVSADGLGNVYISGRTAGDLGGTNAGDSDAFIAKYDDSGAVQWTRQLGSSLEDTSYDISADGLGNVYISGYTYGDLDGSNAGPYDAFISKYNADGTMEWTRQLGTSESDAGWGISADGLGNVYLVGHTMGGLGGPNAGGWDVFLSKFDSSSALQWTRQLGTGGDDNSWGVSADGLGNVYISGRTAGDLGGTNAGDFDAFIRKYDANGTSQWTRQLGTANWDESTDVVVDGVGNVFISGSTEGELGGPQAGGFDAFVSMYDANGVFQWTEQLGSSGEDYAFGVSADGLGGIYISGHTLGDLEGPNAGDSDAFLAKFSFDLAPPGDGNFDGKVDGLDYLIWADHFGDDPADDPPGSPANGDFNGDGVVDGLDYIAWASNFGQGPNDATAVPEPICLAYTGLSLTLLFTQRRRDRPPVS